MESGVLLLSKTSVPPLAGEGLTTPVTPALNPVAPGVVLFELLPLLLLLLPLLLQALISSAATAPTAVVAMMPRLFIP
jgi:hypothetical protein